LIVGLLVGLATIYLTTFSFFGSGSGFFSGSFGLGIGFFGGTIYFFASLIGITEAISSSSKLSAEGSLSDPELSPSSLPVVNDMSFLLAKSSFYKSLALKILRSHLS
jgi:hypothetical protein